MERLMRIDEVAECLRVPVETVRWLRQESRFAPVKVGRRLVWEECAIVVAWAAAQREGVS